MHRQLPHATCGVLSRADADAAGSAGQAPEPGWVRRLGPQAPSMEQTATRQPPSPRPAHLP